MMTVSGMEGPGSEITASLAHVGENGESPKLSGLDRSCFGSHQCRKGAVFPLLLELRGSCRGIYPIPMSRDVPPTCSHSHGSVSAACLGWHVQAGSGSNPGNLGKWTPCKQVEQPDSCGVAIIPGDPPHDWGDPTHDPGRGGMGDLSPHPQCRRAWG